MSADSETTEGGTVWPRARSRVASALRYVGEALGLLRRHPSLLLFPVLVATFSAVESGVGGYIALGHTGYGRWERRHWAREGKREKDEQEAVPLAVRLNPQWALGRGFQQALLETAGPHGAPAWSGVQELMPAVIYGDLDRPRSTSLVPEVATIAALVLLQLVLSPWLIAGYYGMLGDAVKEGRVAWRAFPSRARHCWLRMIALRVLQFVIGGWVIALTSTRVAWFLRFQMAWTFWIGPLVLVLLALAPVLFMMEDARFWRAVSESVATILRRPAVPIVLIVGLTAAFFIVVEAHLAARGTLFPGTMRVGVPSAYLTNIPVDVVYQGLLAALGAWAAMTLFVWQGGRGRERPELQTNTDEQ